jgi:hypothetical protein
MNNEESCFCMQPYGPFVAGQTRTVSRGWGFLWMQYMVRYAHQINLRINFIVQPLLIKCICYVWKYDTSLHCILFAEYRNCLYVGTLLCCKGDNFRTKKTAFLWVITQRNPVPTFRGKKYRPHLQGSFEFAGLIYFAAEVWNCTRFF